MGLDARIYCNCYERGNLRGPPPDGVTLQVGPDGGLERKITISTLAEDKAWDEWIAVKACEHRHTVLISHRLGNIALIGLIRSELERSAGSFPILLGKVIYNGTHGGDYLTIDEVSLLQDELIALESFRSANREAEQFIQEFRLKMKELASASLAIRKPIVF